MGNGKLYLEDFQGLLSGARGRQIKVVCPNCRDSRTNKADRALSINTQTLEYHCHYCDCKGVLKSKTDNGGSFTAERFYKPVKKEFLKPSKPLSVSKYATAFLEYFESRKISENTLFKASVTQELEYFPQLQAKSGCMAFNYMKKGELINTKFRTRNKDFKLISGAELILYNIDSIHPSSYKEGEEKIAILTEGEIDCLSYIECGYEHVVSVPNGANKNLEYLDDYIEEYLDHLDTIYISSDNDKKGVELREELLRRFGEEKCKIVNYPEPCKDVNEVLCAYGKDSVHDCIKKASEIKPDGVLDLDDFEDELDFVFKNGLQRGALTGVSGLDRLISYTTGMLGVVTGVPTHGKTFGLNYIVSRLNIVNDWKIGFFSYEFPVTLHTSQMIETLGGKRFGASNYSMMEYQQLKDYVRRNYFWVGVDNTDIEYVLENARYMIKKRGIKVLIIDPFNSLTDKDKGGKKTDEYISEFLQKLRAFSRKHKVLILLVMHPRKMQKLESGQYPVCDLYDCKGASEVFDKADLGITVWRNNEEQYCEIHVTKVKFRHLGELGHASFKFNINNGRYVEIRDADELKKEGVNISTMSVEWDNSNWVNTKLKGEQVQAEIVSFKEEPKYTYDGNYIDTLPPVLEESPF